MQFPNRRVLLHAGAYLALLGAVSSGGSASAADSSKTLVLMTGVAGDPFYISMECGAAEAAKKQGFKLQVQGPQQWDPALQRPILDSIIASRPAGLIAVPDDSTALQKSLEQAVKEDIKVVLADTTIDDPSVAASAVASDNIAVGRAGFEAVRTLVPKGGKVLMVGSEPGISTGDERAKGFLDAVAADHRYTDVGIQYGKTDTTQSAQVVSAALQRTPDLSAIFAVDSATADGVAAAVRQANLAGKVQVVSVDAVQSQVDALQAGSIQALVAQSPGAIGVEAVEQVIAAIEGKPVTKVVKTGVSIITRATLQSRESQDAIYKSSCAR